jgi:predicted signal transduction protein with EAL and GGDEF domain
MYAAKAAGKDNLHFFTGKLDRQSDERFTLEREMRLALEQDDFSVAYQPKFDRHGRWSAWRRWRAGSMRSWAISGRIVSFRWRRSAA